MNRTKITTAATTRTSTRVGLEFNAVSVAPVKILGQDALSLPSLSASIWERAYFEMQFLDDDLLVFRQSQPGGCLAATRVDSF